MYKILGKPRNYWRVFLHLYAIGSRTNFRLYRPSKISNSENPEREHLLLCSPTGSGKTLTAFLSIIDDLVRRSLDGSLDKSVQCIYISPIKALANDIQKNLIGPLTEIREKYLQVEPRRSRLVYELVTHHKRTRKNAKVSSSYSYYNP